MLDRQNTELRARTQRVMRSLVSPVGRGA